MRAVLYRGGQAALLLAVVVALGLGLVLGTERGRSRLLAWSLTLVNTSIPGRLQVAELVRLGPLGVELAGVTLDDPSGQRVLTLGRIEAALSPLQLLRGRIVIGSLEIGPGSLDLAQLGVPGRGLLAALVDPDVPSAPPDTQPSAYVRVDHLHLHGLSVRAPVVQSLGQLEIRELALSASLVLDQVPRVDLQSLSCELFRGERHVGSVGSLQGRLSPPGQSSELTLSAQLADMRLRLNTRGVLPPAPGFEGSPIEASLGIIGLRAEQLSNWIGDASLAQAWDGELGLELTASGSLHDLLVQGRLNSPAGAVELRSRVKQLRELELELGASELRLSQLRTGLPDQPLSLRMEAFADVADPQNIPLRLRLHSAKLGRFVLPLLDASASWHAGQLTGLHAELRRGKSSIQLEGDLELAGSAELDVTAEIRGPELADLAGALGRSERPVGRVGATLHVARGLGGELRLVGQIGLRQLEMAGTTLASSEITLDLAGIPPELAGKVQARVEGLVTGETQLQRAELHITGGPRRYQIQADADLDRLHAALDLQVERHADRAELRGRAIGQYAGMPFRLHLASTRIGFSGALETDGIVLEGAGQTLRIVGSVNSRDSDLRVTGRDLDLERVSRLLGVTPAWAGAVELSAQLAGTPQIPRVGLVISARKLSHSGQAPIDVSLDGVLDARAGRLQLTGRLGSPSSAQPPWVDAELALTSDFSGGPGWTGQLQSAENRLNLAVRELDLAVLGPWLGQTLPATGKIRLHARLEGALSHPVLHASLAGKVLPTGTERVLSLEHTLDYAAAQLSTQLRVDDALGRWLELDGELTLPPDVTADLKLLAARASQLPDAASWRIHFAAARRGLDQLALPGLPVQAHLELDAALDASHEPGAEPRAQARVRLAQTAAPAAVAGCSGAGLELTLQADLENGRMRTVLLGTHEQRELLRGTSEVELALGAALRGGAPELSVLSSQLSARNLDLQSLPFLCRRLRGKVDAVVDLVDPLGEQPTLRATLSAAGLSLGAEPALQLLLRGHADRGTASVQLSLKAPDGHASIDASLPIEWSGGHFKVESAAPITARALLQRFPIAALLDPSGAVSHASGRLSGDISLKGPLDKPEPSGHLELEDAELTATALAQSLHGVSGRFALDAGVLAIERFEAHDQDGRLQVDGQVRLSAARQIDAALNVVVKDFPLRQQGQVVAVTSAHARIGAKITETRTDLSLVLMDADTWLEKAQRRSGIQLAPHPDFIARARRSNGNGPQPAMVAPGGLPEPEPSADPGAHFTRLSLDASDHFWVKRDDFAIQLSTRLIAEITAAQTKVKGRVDINRGYLDLMGRVFDIQRGSHLEFTGSSVPDPAVAIEATHERRSSGKSIKVKITGRGSRPELAFFIDDAEVSAGDALQALMDNGQRAGSEASAKSDATSFVSGLTAGLLATSARRELGAAAPIIMIEPGEHAGDGRIRAGFELDALVPDVLARFITGVYLEGIVSKEGASEQQKSTRAGVLVELYFPHQLFSTGQWGPGTTWSIDGGWQL